jgi:hypothetical protein
MMEIVLGIRISGETGISFFGIDEVNEEIRKGKRIVSIEPGDAIVEKISEEGGKAQLALAGGNVRIVLND